MKDILKHPLTFEKIFGLLEPTIDSNITIYHVGSIKSILDVFPIKYNDELTELSWSVCIDDEDSCCAGWFLSKDGSCRVHTGCDGDCGHTVDLTKYDNYMKLDIVSSDRDITDELKFIIYDNHRRWMIRVIPSSHYTYFTMPVSLHIEVA